MDKSKSYGRKDVEAILGPYADGSPLDRIVRELEPMGPIVFNLLTTRVEVDRGNGRPELLAESLASIMRRFKADKDTKVICNKFGPDACIQRFADDPVPPGYVEEGSTHGYLGFHQSDIKIPIHHYIHEDAVQLAWHYRAYGG
jgi:hypothetical protein